MGRVLIVGAGGVARVVAHQCARVPEVFGGIMLASRTKADCDRIAAELPRSVETARLDADDVQETVALIHVGGFDPDPFMAALGRDGLPWTEIPL